MLEVTPPMVSLASVLPYVPLHSLQENRLFTTDCLAYLLYVTHLICFSTGRVVKRSTAALRPIPLDHARLNATNP